MHVFFQFAVFRGVLAKRKCVYITMFKNVAIYFLSFFTLQRKMLSVRCYYEFCFDFCRTVTSIFFSLLRPPIVITVCVFINLYTM